MTPEKIKKEILKLDWQLWIRRPFLAFMLSLFEDGLTESSMARIGLKGVDCLAELFQQGNWYQSEIVWKRMEKQLTKHLESHSIFEITASLAKFKKENKRRVISLINDKGDIREKLAELSKILTMGASYIWSAHGLEYYYENKLKKEVPKYVSGDIDKFIGDASFPKKKTNQKLMEEAMRRGDDPEKITRRFSWLRVRDGFAEPFTIKDIKQQMKELPSLEKYKSVKIPKPLKKLFSEVQELVYFRTERTDVVYELLFLARPIIKEAARYYNIPFMELKYYTLPSLIKGKPKKYSSDVSFATYKGNVYYSEKPIIRKQKFKKEENLKGAVAFRGKVVGKAKIVKNVGDISKVKSSDVLVTTMTFPSYVLAMNRAVAFVTDEGGITCHAAIVAREMKKPCIIGTKIATKVLKDGDLVEVDANKGVVKILKKHGD